MTHTEGCKTQITTHTRLPSKLIDDSQYLIAPTTEEEMLTIFDWGDEFEWNECDNDVKPFRAIDSKGFLMGKVNGEPVSCIATLNYENEFFYTGLYIVNKAHRGKGLGLKIFKAAMDYAKDAKVLALDAVESEVKNYQKWGYEIHDRTMTFKKTAEGEMTENLVDLKRVPFEKLVEYDKKVFGYSREGFLKTLLEVEEYRALGYYDGKNLKGFGVLRKARSGYKVGPLSADNTEVAEAILNGLQSFIAGEDVIMESFESNNGAQEIMMNQGWEYVSCLHRMYAKGVPKMDGKKVFAVLTDVG